MSGGMRGLGPQPRAIPLIDGDQLPWLTVEQMREVDRVMMEELQISLVRMMENAGSCLAELARRLLGGDARGRRVVVLAGAGGNGGGGLVAARHLTNALADIEVCVAAPREALSPVPREQLEILKRMGTPTRVGRPRSRDPDLVLDAVLGYSQHGDPRGTAAELIDWSAGHPVLALDTPSGLELTTGSLRCPAVRAEATMTLGAPKEGLRSEDAAGVLGDFFLADISVPPMVYEQLGVSYRSPFGASRIVSVAQRSLGSRVPR